METKIIEALEDETLATAPLDKEMASKVSNYCGTSMGSHLIPLEGASSNPILLEYLSSGYNMEASIQEALQYDPAEDAFTDEEEPVEEVQSSENKG